MIIDPQIGSSLYFRALCNEGVETGQVDQRRKYAAMGRSDYRIGNDFVAPWHFELQPLRSQRPNLQIEPRMERRDTENFLYACPIYSRWRLAHVSRPRME